MGGVAQSHYDIKGQLEGAFEERLNEFDKRFDELSFHIQDWQRALTGMMAELRGQMQTQADACSMRTAAPILRCADQWTQFSARSAEATQRIPLRFEEPEANEAVPLLSNRDDRDEFLSEELENLRAWACAGHH